MQLGKTTVEARVTSKGQITIPQKIRKCLNLKAGSRVIFMQQNHQVVIQPKMKDGLEALLKIREEMKSEGKLIPEKLFHQMIKESKREWSKFE